MAQWAAANEVGPDDARVRPDVRSAQLRESCKVTPWARENEGSTRH